MTAGLAFFARFVLVSSLAFWVWGSVSGHYLATLVPAVNGAYAACGLPVTLDLRGGDLVFLYDRLGGGVLKLQALGHESVYLNLVAAISLLAATANRSLRWMAGWMGLAAALLWLTHVGSFFAAGQIAVWEYAGSLGPAERAALIHDVGFLLPYERSLWLQRGLELWNVWSRYAVGTGLWFLAVATSRPEAARAAAPARTRPRLGLAPARAAAR